MPVLHIYGMYVLGYDDHLLIHLGWYIGHYHFLTVSVVVNQYIVTLKNRIESDVVESLLQDPSSPKYGQVLNLAIAFLGEDGTLELVVPIGTSSSHVEEVSLCTQK